MTEYFDNNSKEVYNNKDNKNEVLYKNIYNGTSIFTITLVLMYYFSFAIGFIFFVIFSFFWIYKEKVEHAIEKFLNFNIEKKLIFKNMKYCILYL